MGVKKQSMPIKYRPDVDGLRAFSVLSVIVFHFHSDILPGGYVGVDVFFVISGYLISKLIISEIDNSTFSFVQFYERRIRRIFPAIFLMLFVGAAASFVFLTPTPFLKYANSAAAAALSVSNIYFYKHSGYFDLGANELPLLHTWSLAVEEQFYLLFPIIFLLGKRFLRLPWLVIFVPLALISLTISVVQTSFARTAAFYLPMSRSWEFLLGSVLALDILPKLGNKTAEILSIVGVGVLAAAMVILDRGAPFPGWVALIPCLGACLIIHTGDGRVTAVGGLLSLRIVVIIGLISYSLYLWHWPALVFMRLFWGGSLSPSESSLVLAGIFGVSWLSWRYVEQPVRRNRALFTRRRLFIGAATSIVLLVGIRSTVNALSGLPQRFNPEAIRLLTDDASTLSNGCATAIEDGGICTVGGPLPPETFAIVGDSYGGALLAGLDFEARRLGSRGLAFIKPGCYPLIDVQVDKLACMNFVREAFESIKSIHTINTVVLVGRWTTAIESRRSGSENVFTEYLQDFSTRKPSYAENSAVFARGIERTRRMLNGCRLFVIAHVPEQRTNVPISAAFRLTAGQSPQIGVPFSIVEEREARTSRILAELAKQYNYTIVDVSKTMCDAHECAGTRDGRSLYSDDNHLSVYGSNLVAQSGLYSQVFADR